MLDDETAGMTTNILAAIPKVATALLPYQCKHEEYFICPTASYWLALQDQKGYCGVQFLH